ncbi:MAG: aminotransferase class V-fold PLP-dependent enzyme [Planctomycetes bacterium]|nr:aminotransferase class V-fold PLP-dependent enzyme [Planctomycetota bacterium]
MHEGDAAWINEAAWPTGADPDAPPRTYLDNAATSWPKPQSVVDMLTHYAVEIGASPGRGAYHESREAAELMATCRQRLCRLFNGTSPDHLIFTLNCSDALNLALRGLVESALAADATQPVHVITTWMDHNSILRPLHELEKRGLVRRTLVECDSETGLVDPEDIRAAIRPDTLCVATLHGSNVSGTLQPIGEIGRVCRDCDTLMVVDAAQSLGHVPVDVQAMCIDLLAFPGHKGLLGPLGTGGLYIRPGLEDRLATVREGGTGSVSEVDYQPDFLPDKYEPGSHNALGIAALSEGVGWLLNHGIDRIRQHEEALMQQMMTGLGDLASSLDGRFRWYGPRNLDDRCGVYSVLLRGQSPDGLSHSLEQQHGLLTRPGLHCAPLAHRTFGTHDHGGTTRLSFGPFLGAGDVSAVLAGLADVCRSCEPVATATG